MTRNQAVDLEKISKQLSNQKNIEDILQKYNWKTFERIAGDIFKTKRRYEIDIVAVKSNQIFCVDCKWWGKGRYKKTGLRHAIESQENRVKEFTKFLRKNTIARSLLKITSKYKIYPLLITLHEEAMVQENETFVVPVWKLNSFIIQLEDYF